MEVAGEVSENPLDAGEDPLEAGDLPANTSYIASSAERCRSRYTLKLLDAQPPVRIISDKVDPELRIAVAAPRLKQWGEYFSAPGTLSFPKTARKIREKFFPCNEGKSGAPGAVLAITAFQKRCIGQLCRGSKKLSPQKQGLVALKLLRVFLRFASFRMRRCSP